MFKRLSKIFKTDLGKSISSGYLLFFLNNIVALFLTPYMLRYISKEEYGLYIMCVDFLAWIGFLEFGTSKVLESKAGHLIAQNDFKALNTSFNTSLFFQIIISVIIFPLFFSLIYWGVDKPRVPHLDLIITIFSITASLTVFRNLFSSLIIASKKIHLDNRIQIITNVLNYVLILFLAPYIGVVGLASITLFTLVIMLIRSNFRVKQLFPQIKISRKAFNKKELKRIFGLGLYFSLGSIATVLLLKIDSFVIGREFGLATVASFYITIKLYSLIQKVFQMFLNNFRPHISQMYGKNEFENIRTFYNIIAPVIICFGVLGISLVMIINPYFVHLWVGDSLFISDNFNMVYGVWLILELYTLLVRIILVPSLYAVRAISIVKFLEAAFRVGALALIVDKFGILALPISSLIGSLLLGCLFFYFCLNRYFSDHKVKGISSTTIIILLGISLSLFVLIYLNKSIYFKYSVLIFSIVFGIYFWIKQKNNLKSVFKLFMK